MSAALEQSTYLSTDQVRARFGGVSRMWVHRAIRHRGFPKPLKLGGSAQSHRRNARAAAAATHTRAVEVSQRDLDLYSPRHVTTREAVALPPRHQAPVEAMLADGLISQFADALAVAEAETYDAVFDPDFYLTNPVCEFWRGQKLDRATP